MNHPQIKICGLTQVDEALFCAQQGADAIGMVFYEKSPRNVSVEKAHEICRALPPGVVPTGVFVNENFDTIMGKVERCGLKAVQLHGNEQPDLVEQLNKEHLIVIKVLYMESEPTIQKADTYDPTAFLVECAKGILPGGNALSWNFERVKALETDKPVIIAGGLSPENISQAIVSAMPHGVDVSSGVERIPGRKDLLKVKAFITAVKQTAVTLSPRRIF
ncbi:MAG: phosphoribosylanthranilate isomerase [Proteobacteria bacterium]|nr:phosphoribosylanthranilate isomerase [Pseudomonadota bacterium]